MEETTEKSTFLTKMDRCDSKDCPAQAFVLVKFITGELLFCGHHYNKYEASLIKDSYEIIDERDTINAKSESST